MPVKPGQWVHMVGIAGAGMSGIAMILAQRGFRVSGSDLQKNTATDRLEELGIEVFEGHSSSNVKPGIDVLVVSSAIPASNCELVAAINNNIPVMKRGQMLAELVNSGKGIAVAGAHGKTTTTSMIYRVLGECGLDPTFILGGELKDSGLNARVGNSTFAVVEADESDASFLELRPYIAVVTNIEDDHLDYYKTLKNIERAFEQFVTGIQDDGLAVLYGGDPAVQNIKRSCRARVITYGENPEFDYCLCGWQAEGEGSVFDVWHKHVFLGTVRLSVPGKHNALNALASIATAMELNIDFQAAANALAHFTGAKRRYQLIGTFNQISIVDDYAHHPTEIKATIDAARSVHQGRIIVVFQPHRYTRTRMLGAQLGQALVGADLCIVTEIYAAGESSIPGVNGKTIAEAAQKAGGRCIFLSSFDEMEHYLLQNARACDLIITMGAGDIWKLGHKVLGGLQESIVRA